MKTCKFKTILHHKCLISCFPDLVTERKGKFISSYLSRALLPLKLSTLTPSGKVCDGHGCTWGTTGESGCNWRLSHDAGARAAASAAAAVTRWRRAQLVGRGGFR